MPKNKVVISHGCFGVNVTLNENDLYEYSYNDTKINQGVVDKMKVFIAGKINTIEDSRQVIDLFENIFQGEASPWVKCETQRRL